MMRRVIHIDQDKCVSCDKCVTFCPTGAIAIGDGGAELISDDMCDGLAGCLDVCPVGAIRLEVRPAEAFAVTDMDGHDLVRHRLAKCTSASPCGRICHRLIKQPGKAGVWCVDLADNSTAELYAVLAEPDFRCPEGTF